jgi:hypothetical protein
VPRTVFYSPYSLPHGEFFRLSAVSRSQTKQLEAADRDDQIREQQLDLADELARLLGKFEAFRNPELSPSEPPMANPQPSPSEPPMADREPSPSEPPMRKIDVPGGGVVVISDGGEVLADKDGIIWMRQVLAGAVSFVFDPLPRPTKPAEADREPRVSDGRSDP